MPLNPVPTFFFKRSPYAERYPTMKLIRLPFKILVCLFLAVIVIAQTPPALVTIPDITGDGTVHAISTGSGTFRSILIRALDTNSTATCNSSSVAGCVRYGDSNISTSRGMYLKPGESSGWIESAGSTRRPLNTWFYLIQSGDKLAIIYEQ